MTIRFACRCGKKMKTTDDKIGKKVLCSACGSPVVVPSSNTDMLEKVVAPSVGAADSANELLRGSANQQKTRKNLAFDDPTMEAGVSYDTRETFKYYTIGVLLPALGVLAACLLLFGISNWVMRPNLHFPDLAEVQGVVYLNDRPLANAMVVFRPMIINAEGIKISSSVGRTDAKGHYRLRYIENVYGAALGECAVQLSARDELGREVVPVSYRGNSNKNTKKVEPGSNTIDFNLHTAEPEAPAEVEQTKEAGAP